ncbi:MAG: Lrp/AsnC family transcriptional regulator [Pseudomonadota bacterium]
MTDRELTAQDARVLDVLQADGRISSADLAAATNLSPATCWRRVRALETRGVITGYAAQLDRRAVGFSFSAFVHVSIVRQYRDVVDEIADKIKRRPEVLACYATTGDADFTLHIVARDIEHYDRFLSDFLFGLPGVGQVRSNVVLREIKQTSALPLSSAGA